jgi:type III secretion system YscQ/HrcQ family protein
MNGAAWPLPGLSGAQAALCGLLAGRNIAIALGLEAEPGLSLCPLPADALPGAGGVWPAPVLRLTLRLGEERWLILLPEAATESLFALPEGISPEDLPAELRGAALSLALEPLLLRAKEALGREITLEEPRPEAESAPAPEEAGMLRLPFALRSPAGAVSGRGEARLPASSLPLLEAVSRMFPPRRADLSALPLPLSLCAAAELFPLKLLRQAETGDILIFAVPAAYDSPGGSLHLEINGRSAWKAVRAEGAFTLTEKEEDMPQDASADRSNAGLDLESLELRLSLELEERLVTLAELAALAPGHVFVSSAPADAPVTLKANGRRIGRGRLVDADGRLGVMLTEFSPPPPESPDPKSS